jgi:DnaJ-class molecular chaperone
VPSAWELFTSEEMLNPEAHGLQECSHCNGYGSSLKEEAERCTVCGGMGLIRKKEEPAKNPTRKVQWRP